MADLIDWGEKDPSEALDYMFDWASPLGTDTITGTPTWIIYPSGELTQPTGATNTTTTSTIWVGAGRINVTYVITCRIVTSGGRTFEQSAKLSVVAK